MLKKLDRNCRCWIKGDGTDVVKGLWESVNREWAGDVDLNDGRLREQYQQHKNLSGPKTLNCKDRISNT